MDPSELRSQIRGDVVAISDPEYEEVRRNLVWNELKPLRRPALIVQVSSERDVVEAVRFARGHRLPVGAALRAERSYAPANWKRLQLLREKYDPGGLFRGHFR
jgi:FAD/FMN-containing dehydrogenase